MSYVLIYAVEGHELSTEPLESLSAINERIHHLHNTSHVGITVLRIEEEHDGPRTWQIKYPPAPPAGTRVETKDGDVFTVLEGGERVSNGHVEYRWKTLLETAGPLTEVVETEVEAAARRLRAAGGVKGHNRFPYEGFTADVQTVADHALNGGQL